MNHTTTSPLGVNAPYRVAPDTFVIPELVPGPPGTYVSLNSMVITGAEPVIVDTGNELSRREWMDAAFSVVDPATSAGSSCPTTTTTTSAT